MKLFLNFSLQKSVVLFFFIIFVISITSNFNFINKLKLKALNLKKFCNKQKYLN